MKNIWSSCCSDDFVAVLSLVAGGLSLIAAKLVVTDEFSRLFEHRELEPTSVADMLTAQGRYVVIGAFVNPLKLSRRCLRLWRDVLERIPRARLAFSPANPALRASYLRLAAAVGIAQERACAGALLHAVCNTVCVGIGRVSARAEVFFEAGIESVVVSIEPAGGPPTLIRPPST